MDELVIAFHVACLVQYKEFTLTEATDYIMQNEIKDVVGDIGFIAIDNKGTITLPFNSARMHRGYRNESTVFTSIY